MADPSTVKDLERAISRALAKAGHGGTVIIRDNFCELHTDSPVVAIDLGDWVEQWNLLPDDIKEKRAQKAAGRLTNALLESQGRSAPVPAAVLRARVKRIATTLVAVATVGLVGWWLFRTGFFGQAGETDETAGSSSPSSTVTKDEDPAARAARERRVCSAARQRIYQGGTLGMDIAGWVVELWLARDGEPLSSDETLQKLVNEGVGDALEAKGPGEVSVHPGGTEDERAGLGLSTAVVRFSEGYAVPFFNSAGRERFLALAEGIADDVGAVHAGLYARCAHLPSTRDVGAWYRGVDENGAVVSLLLAAGRQAQPPAFDAEKIAAGDAHGLLSKLRTKVATMDKAELDDILRKQGGRPHEHQAEGGRTAVSLRFPLGGPTRPANASRDIAAEMGL